MLKSYLQKPNEDIAAKLSPTKVNACDVKGDPNEISCTLQGKQKSSSSIEAQVSSSKLPYVILADDIRVVAGMSMIEQLNANVVIDPILSNMNISPRGTGDYTIEDLLNMQNENREEESKDEEERNFIIDILSQTNSADPDFIPVTPKRTHIKIRASSKKP